ncbi:hypothetical protein [Flavobacterium solisilvae]|uniref:C1q domain-containing protein n=1 Tax=Flavobacterium solisilvae TaxID=1852019 RepID=A0ABX1QWY6_9FLAO|nr:hypothetical protein [Flavobacterium solisilvae]NMH25628.1 hypothetical protein [Flavobacterium solisilvae]
MKSKISFLLLFISTLSLAQVGIGTTSPNAQLDIQASNPALPTNTDGILIPKIVTFPISDPGLNQQGMLVYLTTATVYKTINKPSGFYYWDNGTANWIQIQTGSSNLDWNVTGNAATNPNTNFIGTTDNTDIVFKRNNVRAGFIGNPDTTSGNRNTSFGANALNPAGTGTRNTAIGTNVLPVNTIGQLNVAIGDQTMVRNTTGQANIAIGVGALNENVSGNGNVAIGRNALVKTNDDFNTGVGLAALRRNISGKYNVALGANAGFEVLGGNNVFIGANAGYNETGSNKLYVHGSDLTTLSNTGPDAALIYGEFDNKILRVNGGLQISNTTAERYSLPTNRGTVGQVLQTDGVGATNWVNSTTYAAGDGLALSGNTFSLPTMSIAKAKLSANQSFLADTNWQKILFNAVDFDSNSEFDTTNSLYRADKAGYYRIKAAYCIQNDQNDNSRYGISININGNFYQETTYDHHEHGLVARAVDCLVYLAENDYVEVFIRTAQSVAIDSYGGKTTFEVQQLR